MARDIMLAARKLSKSYGGTQVLAPLDLEVGAGEVCCLLGPNGAGKTTTLRLFLGFARPSSGEALVGGVRVEQDPIAARRQLSYVPEQVQLYPELTGAENLAYFAALAGAEKRSGEELAELLVGAGLPRAAVDRPASGYSKGMRQKVALALSRAKRSAALLLDEPTSGLDPSAVRDLCAGILRERERGTAVLMVTHDLATVAGVADQIGILRAGHLVHLGARSSQTEAEIASLYRIALEGDAVEPPSSQRAWASDQGATA
jgi:ABC-2 type transport system ATP-binding protein